MSRKKAVVIIHGIGEQKPFETLDAFVRTFVSVYETENKTAPFSLSREHCLVAFPGWVESCVSLKSKPEAGDKIDIYEYYWSYMTQRQITFSEILGWLFDVAKGSSGGTDEKGLEVKFKKLKYLCRMLSAVGLLRAVISIPLSVLIVIPPLWRKITAFLSKPVVDFFGDVVLYASSDQKSKFFPIRQKILEEGVKKVKHILEKLDYNEIVLAGHSLGSVIAYDILDRLNKEMNVNASLREHAVRLKGLVTFGSPLDKIAFFFDEKIDRSKQGIRYAIVSQLHGFKRVPAEEENLRNGLKAYFEHVKWLNFWTKGDPVCDSLSVYRDVANEEVTLPFKTKNPLACHGFYWQSPFMYQRIIHEFFK